LRSLEHSECACNKRCSRYPAVMTPSL
jgi:hypothetical protein